MINLTDSIEAVAFDLDGTLIDTVPDLAAAANMMLALMGGRSLSERQVARLIGDGIDQLVTRVLAVSRDGVEPDPRLIETAAVSFRDLYRQRLFERSRIYLGVVPTLRALASAGMNVCCITNKESAFARPLIEAAGLRELLSLTLSAESWKDRKPSPTMLLSACSHLGIEASRMLYVGDAPSDVIAARAAGCRAVAVNYGYHTHPVLAAVRPDRIVSRLTELIEVNTQPRPPELRVAS